MAISESEPSMTAEHGATTIDERLAENTKNEVTEKQSSVELTSEDDQYVEGWRLHLATLGLLILVFLVQMESSIASTTLLGITNQFGGYEKSSWVFTAYMLTYCGES